MWIFFLSPTISRIFSCRKNLLLKVKLDFPVYSFNFHRIDHYIARFTSHWDECIESITKNNRRLTKRSYFRISLEFTNPHRTWSHHYRLPSSYEYTETRARSHVFDASLGQFFPSPANQPGYLYVHLYAQLYCCCKTCEPVIDVTRLRWWRRRGEEVG